VRARGAHAKHYVSALEGRQAHGQDRACLADAVGAAEGLDVRVWVPVAVVDDDRVGARQVEPEPARARAQQENEVTRAGRVEALDGALPLAPWGEAPRSEVISGARRSGKRADRRRSRRYGVWASV